MEYIGDQPILCQLRTRRVSSSQTRLLRRNAHLLKPICRVAAVLLSLPNVIIPSVTTCWGRDSSLRPGSAVVFFIAWSDKLKIPPTHIWTIDWCFCKTYPATRVSGIMNVVDSDAHGWTNSLLRRHSCIILKESVKQINMLIQSTRCFFISLLKDKRLTNLQCHEKVWCIIHDKC